MREIKFRAWDKSIGKMAKVEVIDNQTSDTKTFIGTEHDRVLEWLPDMENDCVLMQYTGLKDKNGKEIYEGDILEQEYRGRGEVYWCEGSGCYGVGVEGWDLDRMAKGEIVGNIYENPELLKEVA